MVAVVAFCSTHLFYSKQVTTKITTFEEMTWKNGPIYLKKSSF